MIKDWRHSVVVGCALLLCLAVLPAGAADLVETARSTKELDNSGIDHFAIALEAAGLALRLSAGSYTVFAPTNQALRRLDVGKQYPGGPAMSPEAKLRAADQDRLAEVLKSYIVEGAIPYNELVGRQTLETLGGTTLEVKPTEGGVMVNNIRVASPTSWPTTASSTWSKAFSQAPRSTKARRPPLWPAPELPTRIRYVSLYSHEVVFPMARAGLFATAVFTFVFAWNDFIFALVLTRREVTTFPVQVTHYFGGQSNFWAKIAAMSVLGTVPIFVVGRVRCNATWCAGISLGAVKG